MNVVFYHTFLNFILILSVTGSKSSYSVKMPVNILLYILLSLSFVITSPVRCGGSLQGIKGISEDILDLHKIYKKASYHMILKTKNSDLWSSFCLCDMYITVESLDDSSSSDSLLKNETLDPYMGKQW